MSRGTPLTLAILNDYEVVVRGVQAMLAPFADRVQVIEVGTDDQVNQPVDVTLFDTFATIDRDEGLDGLLGKVPGPLVVYSWTMDPDVVELALAMGCAGYLDKALDAETLVAALEQVVDGEVVVRPAGRGQAVPTTPVIPVEDWPTRDLGLSPREAEIVALVTQGLTNQDIAAQTYLSINTVKTFIRSAYRKMGVTRRSEAVRWGMDNGLVPLAMHRTRPID